MDIVLIPSPHGDQYSPYGVLRQWVKLKHTNQTSHEAWEEIWQEHFGPSRKFYQGLIQAAVALHHFGNGNIRGAKKVYYGSRGYLEPYRPLHMGIDLDTFLGQMDQCFAQVVASQE